MFFFWEKEIKSVKAYVEDITKMRAEAPAGTEQWFFRGQKNASWDVRPYVFRDDNLANEHIGIERAQRQNPVEFRECVNNFEILTKLQHYGLGTRLLDLTLNPLVALYFATEKSSEYKKNLNGQYTWEEHDGKVLFRYVVGCTLADIQVRIALSLPFLEFGKSLTLEALCATLRDNKAISQYEFERLIDNEYDKMIQLLQTNSFINAANSNTRLIQQRGAFLLSPAVNIKTITEINSSILSKAKMDLAKEFEGCFVIPAKLKSAIREELDFFNVNEATLFPELEHQMSYIQNRAVSPIGTVEEYTQYKRPVEPSEARKFDKAPPDITTVLRSSLPTMNESVLAKITGILAEEVQILDWHLKDSVRSRMRRSITKHLADSLSAVDARSKADEIVKKLAG